MISIFETIWQLRFTAEDILPVISWQHRHPPRMWDQVSLSVRFSYGETKEIIIWWQKSQIQISTKLILSWPRASLSATPWGCWKKTDRHNGERKIFSSTTRNSSLLFNTCCSRELIYALLYQCFTLFIPSCTCWLPLRMLLEQHAAVSPVRPMYGIYGWIGV